MASKTFQITGKILDIKTKKGLPGLSVQAWDKDLIVDDMVGSAVLALLATIQ